MLRPLIGRAPNFSAREVEALLNNIEMRPALNAPFSPVVRVIKGGSDSSSNEITLNQKLQIWNEIAEEVNAVEGDHTGVRRTAKELKKKWSDLKSRVKIKAEDIQKGKLPKDTKFSSLEERVLNIMKLNYLREGVESAPSPVYIHSFNRREKDLSADSIELKHEMYPEENSESCDYSNNRDESINQDESDNCYAVESQEVQRIVENVNAFKLPNIITVPSPVTKESPRKMIKNTETSNKRKRKRTQSHGTDSDVPDMIGMLLESHSEMRKELKDIKRIMFKMTQQKRKRLEQENEKIQLKKMKILLQCKKMNVDYDDFITDFL